MISKLERYSFQIGKVFKCYGLQVDEVIKRLQMWEDFKEKYDKNAFKSLEDRSIMLKDLVGNIMYEFEQKYFSKEIDSRSDIEKDVDDLVTNYSDIIPIQKKRLRDLIISVIALFEKKEVKK